MDNGVSHFLHLSYISSICLSFTRNILHVNSKRKASFSRWLEIRWAIVESCTVLRLPCISSTLSIVRYTEDSFSLYSKRGAFFSEETIVETCAVSRLFFFFFPSIYRLLRGRFSLNSKRKAFFFEVAREHGYRLAQSHF